MRQRKERKRKGKSNREAVASTDTVKTNSTRQDGTGRGDVNRVSVKACVNTLPVDSKRPGR